MAFYSVYEQPEPPTDRVDRGAALTFIGDRFAWGALVFGPLWLIGNRLWLAFVAYAVVMAGLLVLLKVAGASPQWAALLIGAANLILAFEAGSLKRAGLERRGWNPVGSVTGRSRLDCERRFFDDWLGRQPVIARRGDADASPAAAPMTATVSGRTRFLPANWRGF